jgi:hypothetical protein
MISSGRFTELFLQLESAFNGKIPKVRLELLWESIKGYTDGQVVRGLAYIINHKTHLPINHDILQACQIEREKEDLGQKAIDRQKDEGFYNKNKQRTQLGRDAIECIQKLIGENSREKKIALVMDLHEKYPGVGFGEVTQKWKNQENQR